MRDFLFSVGFLVASQLWIPLASCQKPVDSPSASNFLRRSFASAAVLGDYIYIDGGEVSQTVDGKQPSSDRPSYLVNSTLTISLKESWTNSTVTIDSINKNGTGAPLLGGQALWPDPSSRAFYAWGGQMSYFSKPPDNSLWKFTANDSGGGSWSQVRLSNAGVFNQSVRSQGCASTVVKGVGYCVGGFVNGLSDGSVSSLTGNALPGMVTFGMNSGGWANTSTPALGNFGTFVHGRVEYIPFGPSGLLVFLGGAEAPVGSYPAASSQLDFSNITVYDLATRAWFSQKASGDGPSPRERFCTVSVQGPNNTYEIFIYGGLSAEAGNTSDEVYVLSLPGFVFFKATAPGTPRGDHACVVAGKRQMLSIGGTDGFRGFPKSMLDPDPWKLGLGVFDMVKMSWADKYDANAAAYETPEFVRLWYTQGGLATVPWSSDGVKALFSTVTPNFSPSPQDAAGTLPTPPAAPLLSTGVIIGIAAGGAGVLGLAVGLAIYCLRRKRLSKQHSPLPDLPATWVGGDPAGWTGYAVQVRGNATPVPFSPVTTVSPPMRESSPSPPRRRTPKLEAPLGRRSPFRLSAVGVAR